MLLKQKIILFVILTISLILIFSSCCTHGNQVEPDEQDLKKKLDLIHSLIEQPGQMIRIINKSGYKFNIEEHYIKDTSLLNENAGKFINGYKIVKNQMIKLFHDDDYHAYEFYHRIAIESNDSNEKVLYFHFVKIGNYWKFVAISDWIETHYGTDCNIF